MEEVHVTSELIVAAEAGKVGFALRLNYISLRSHRPTSVVVCQRWETDGEVKKKGPSTCDDERQCERKAWGGGGLRKIIRAIFHSSVAFCSFIDLDICYNAIDVICQERAVNPV